MRARSIGLALAALALGVAVGGALRCSSSATRVHAIRDEHGRVTGPGARARDTGAGVSARGATPEPLESSRGAPSPARYTAARAYEAQLGNMQEVYAKERRVEPWASGREHALADYVLADLQAVDPGVRLETDCRESSCRIRIYSESPHLSEAMAPFPFACQGSHATPEFGTDENGAHYADVYLLFGDENLTDEAYALNRENTCPQYRSKFQAVAAQAMAP